MMTELQTVETLNCLIERMETPPFYRLTSMRKTSGMGPASSNNVTTSSVSVSGGSGGGVGVGGGGGVGGVGGTGRDDGSGNSSGGGGGVGGGPVELLSTNVNENETEHTTSHASAGMIHTKRHSGDDPSKIIGYVFDATLRVSSIVGYVVRGFFFGTIFRIIGEEAKVLFCTFRKNRSPRFSLKNVRDIRSILKW